MAEGRIRQMTTADIPMVHAIEMLLMPTPWSEKVFHDCLLCGYRAWVLEFGDGVIGFTMTSQRIDECHLMNLGVLPSWQQQGFGQQLLEYVITDAKAHEMRKVFLEVRRSNKPAIALYKKYQFMQVGVRKNYYPLSTNEREDALLFILQLS